MSDEFNYGPRPKQWVYVSEFEALKSRALAAEQERDKALALVASYDRQDELIGTEFEGVDEVTEIVQLLKNERDQLKAELQQARDWLKTHGRLAYASLLEHSSSWRQDAAKQLFSILVILEGIEKEKK